MLELDGNNNTIIKNNAGGVIIKTSDVSQVIVTTANTEIVNKLKTSGGIVCPTTGLTYTSDMIGYSFVTNSTDATFTSGVGTTTATATITTGNWLYSCAQIITRGTGSFTTASLTQLQLTVTTGTGVLNGMNMFSPIPSGSTLARLVFPMTTGTIWCKSATCIITITSATTMTVSATTKRLDRLILTRVS
jgi:phosphohistidine swiveling domain-containing protein